MYRYNKKDIIQDADLNTKKAEPQEPLFDKVKDYCQDKWGVILSYSKTLKKKYDDWYYNVDWWELGLKTSHALKKIGAVLKIIGQILLVILLLILYVAPFLFYLFVFLTFCWRADLFGPDWALAWADKVDWNSWPAIFHEGDKHILASLGAWAFSAEMTIMMGICLLCNPVFYGTGILMMFIFMLTWNNPTLCGFLSFMFTLGYPTVFFPTAPATSGFGIFNAAGERIGSIEIL